MTKSDLRRHGIDLSPKQARAALHGAAWKIVTGNDLFDESYVQYQGRWLLLCREDLSREVKTTPEAWTIAEACDAILYGARITETDFVVVDSATDG